MHNKLIQTRSVMTSLGYHVTRTARLTPRIEPSLAQPRLTYPEQQRRGEVLGLCLVGAHEGALDDAVLAVERVQQ